MNSPHDFSEILFITSHLIVRGVFTLVGAVVQDHQVGFAVLQLLSPMLFVHDALEQTGISAIHTQTVVNHTRSVILDHSSEQTHISVQSFDLETVRA